MERSPWYDAGMDFLSWFHSDWFLLLQSLGIIAGLVFNGISHVLEARAQRAANLLEITKRQTELWSQLYSRSDLKRVVDTKTKVAAEEITFEEELFVTQLILHLSSAYRTKQLGMVTAPEKLRADITSFFSCSIPRAVWERCKFFHDADFVRFVELGPPWLMQQSGFTGNKQKPTS